MQIKKIGSKLNFDVEAQWKFKCPHGEGATSTDCFSDCVKVTYPAANAWELWRDNFRQNKSNCVASTSTSCSTSHHW